ncbi:MAG: oligopeptidase B [Zetaproteobacteria bacterium]|nr:oligopeptidase B [Pseudobdellovibrionaceae bacterium]
MIHHTPKAQKISQKMTIHNHTREDPWFWLNQRENKNVREYLEAENDYVTTQTSAVTSLENKIFEELKGRIKHDDITYPVKKGDYYYYVRTEEGQEYPIYCRKKRLDKNEEEEIYLDGNVITKGYNFAMLRAAEVSPNGQMLAYTLDTEGRNKYTLNVINISTGEKLLNPVIDMTGNVVWAADNKTILYTVQDPTTLRANKLYRQKLGSDNPTLIFEEKDETFRINISLTKSRKYLRLTSSSTLASEIHLLNSENPWGNFKVFSERQKGHEYTVEDGIEQFFIRTNREAQNFRIMTCGQQSFQEDQWQEWLPHCDNTLIESIESFSKYLVVKEIRDGLAWLRMFDLETKESHLIDFGEQTWSVSLAGNWDFESKTLRFVFESLHIPQSVIDYDMENRTSEVKKEREIPSGYNKELYETKRIFTEARDGTKVPVSLVYRKDTALDGSAPLLAFSYGSYGRSMPPWFCTARISLLDRGFIFAIAHVRGGAEMGQVWYEAGKLLNKKNTFYDFIDVAKDLVKRQFTSHDRLFAMGGSAGGLLIGSVLNMAPEVFHGAIAEVPFVDIVTTMLDDSIPLTTAEYDEWGNPNEENFYRYMLSYSPYDNVQKQDYPHLFVFTGFHDPQVQYWEPAKWVAKLRDYKTNDTMLLFKTNFAAGHGGASGRYEALKEQALKWAFLLNLSGKEA